MKFEILTNPYHFHIKYRLESTKKTLGYAQTKQIKIVKICQFGHFWPFLAIFGISPLKNIGFFIFFYTAANFTLMCLRNDKNNFGTRRLRKCYWFSKFQVERFFTIFGPFLAVLGIFPPKYVGIFTFYCIATYLICIKVKIPTYFDGNMPKTAKNGQKPLYLKL